MCAILLWVMAKIYGNNDKSFDKLCLVFAANAILFSITGNLKNLIYLLAQDATPFKICHDLVNEKDLWQQ